MKFFAHVRKVLPVLACDLIGLSGAGLLTYGMWLIYEPAGFLTAGTLLMTAACLLARRRS